MTVIEVFADVACPFTHVGLRRFVELRANLDRPDVTLWVRAWPLEIVNGAPLDPAFIGAEVNDIRSQVAPDLFNGFTQAAFPASSLPALTLAATAYTVDRATGEAVSLALRDLLFEQGANIAHDDVLSRLAATHGLTPNPGDAHHVHDDHAEGLARGVVGSPHFFTPDGGFFCPSLDIHRDDEGHLRISADASRFEGFIASCFS